MERFLVRGTQQIGMRGYENIENRQNFSKSFSRGKIKSG